MNGGIQANTSPGEGSQPRTGGAASRGTAARNAMEIILETDKRSPSTGT